MLQDTEETLNDDELQCFITRDIHGRTLRYTSADQLSVSKCENCISSVSVFIHAVQYLRLKGATHWTHLADDPRFGMQIYLFIYLNTHTHTHIPRALCADLLPST